MTVCFTRIFVHGRSFTAQGAHPTAVYLVCLYHTFVYIHKHPYRKAVSPSIECMDVCSARPPSPNASRCHVTSIYSKFNARSALSSTYVCIVCIILPPPVASPIFSRRRYAPILLLLTFAQVVYKYIEFYCKYLSIICGQATPDDIAEVIARIPMESTEHSEMIGRSETILKIQNSQVSGYAYRYIYRRSWTGTDDQQVLSGLHTYISSTSVPNLQLLVLP